MDTEEDLKIQHAIRTGKSETDEGPYYHTSWWESYKGSIKGKLGGAAIGALIGGVIGALTAAAIVLTGGISLAAGVAIAGSFAAGGMVYGSHEFSDVGKVTGAVAAAHEKSEERMKSYTEGKFSEIKKEIGELKSAITGEPVPPALAAAPAKGHDDSYRTQHCDDGHCPPQKRKLIFWKIALIGLAVGMAAGGLLAFGGIAGHILGAVSGLTATSIPQVGGVYAASMTVMGLFGASFGINRDVFRQMFDKTDRLFKGLLSKGRSEMDALAQEPAPAIQMKMSAPQETAVSPPAYENFADFPESTYHREKLMAQARQTLLSMDHTKFIPH